MTHKPVLLICLFAMAFPSAALAQQPPTVIDTAIVTPPIPNATVGPSAPEDTAEIGVDLVPDPSALRDRGPSFGAPAAGAMPPGTWSLIDLLPPEGPTPGAKPSAGKPVVNTRLVSFMGSDGRLRTASGPALVAPTTAVALLEIAASRSYAQVYDTVVSSSRSFRPGAVIRYSYIALPGWTVTGAWAMTGSTATRLPASGTWRFSQATVIMPDVVPADAGLYPSYSGSAAYPSSVRGTPSHRATSDQRIAVRKRTTAAARRKPRAKTAVKKAVAPSASAPAAQPTAPVAQPTVRPPGT